MSVFDRFMNETVTILRQDGSRVGPYKCSFQTDRVRIDDTTLDVNEGDTVERELPNRKTESHEILEAQFSNGQPPMIPPSWRLLVRKTSSRRRSGGPTTNIRVDNSSGFQIGNHNVQEISHLLQPIIDAIDGSDASEKEKREAKSRFQSFLQHPAVTATLGASVGAIAKSLL